MPSRPHGTVAVLVVLAVLLSPAVSTVSVTAAPDDTGTYAVAQGTTCTPVAPVSNTSQNVTTFYDYRNPYPEITGRPYATTYSSYGTDEYQISDGSSLFFYTGSEGTSLVVLHDRLGDDEGEPGTVTLRERDTTAQKRVAVEDLPETLGALRAGEMTFAEL